jgi:hypothetical protein
MTAGFAGFPKEAIAFLRALKRNNCREWFQARKDIYETKVKAPTLEMAAALDERLLRAGGGSLPVLASARKITSLGLPSWLGDSVVENDPRGYSMPTTALTRMAAMPRGIMYFQPMFINWS